MHLREVDKGIAVEVGIRHGHGQTEKYILDPIAQAGGRVDFIFLFNDHTGGRDSDKLFHDNVLRCLRSAKSHGLTPELGTI